MPFRRAASLVLAPGLLMLLVAALAVACGPSPLDAAYEAFRARVDTKLEEEVQVWNQVADLAAGQDDPKGVARYRAHLADRALPYYSALGRDFESVEPGHEALAPAKEALVAYAKARREFVDLEIRRIELAANAAAIPAIEAADLAVLEARKAYVEAVGDDVPDGRFGETNVLVQDFLRGPYRKAVEGAMEPRQAVSVLRRDFLPRMDALRSGRFDDDARGKAFRKLVVASHEFLTLLADPDGGLPAVVEILRAKARVESVQADADRERDRFQKTLRDVQRAR